MATVSIKMDDVTKTKFSEFCESVGLTTSAVINMFAKRVVRDNKIPFEITGAPEPSEQFLAAIKEAEEIASNPNGKGFVSVDELFKDLNA
ncbi:MAG: type II toxin-antitoxin system RelB/DinJ family antitoxin [Treponema sp.]|nr:type II toxin-antitoxin system RelB/DinJ family antitoxin [Treponema sp.]